MNSPSPPPAPDPKATAQAQGQMNKETAISQAQLNMVNQNGPGGSSVYNQIGSYADGTPKFEQNVSLSPAAQALYDSQNNIQQKALDLGQGAIGRVSNAIAQPFDVSNLPGQVFGVKPGDLQYNVGDTGQYQSNVPGQQYQTSIPGQQYQTSLGPDYRRTIAGSEDYAGNVKSVQDALMARMAPQIEQDRTRLETRLANQGITGTSDAYGQAQFRQEQNINDQRTAALLAASQEQSRLAALDAQAGNFANNAALNEGNFANNARGQQFTTDAAQGAFANDAKSRQFATDLAGGNFSNDVVRQRLVDALTKADLNNSTQTLAFNQGQSNAALNNSGRQTGIQEAAYLRSQPFNELASLMGFAPGVQVPQFQNTTATGIAAPDYQGAVATKYAGDMEAYRTKQQAQSALLGSIFGAAGTAGGFAMMSDRRAKTNIRRIGTANNGLPIYSYNYKSGGPTQIGFMADEVKKAKPWAVVNRDGFDMVNYEMAVA